MLASAAFDAGIISSQIHTTLVVAAVLTSQVAGAWLDFVLREGWPLLAPARHRESNLGTITESPWFLKTSALTNRELVGSGRHQSAACLRSTFLKSQRHSREPHGW